MQGKCWPDKNHAVFRDEEWHTPDCLRGRWLWYTSFYFPFLRIYRSRSQCTCHVNYILEDFRAFQDSGNPDEFVPMSDLRSSPTHRVHPVFLWRPKKLSGKWKWLCRAQIYQTLIHAPLGVPVGPIWISLDWAEDHAARLLAT